MNAVLWVDNDTLALGIWWTLSCEKMRWTEDEIGGGGGGGGDWAENARYLYVR